MKMILDYNDKWYKVIEIKFISRVKKIFYPFLIKKLIKELNSYGMTNIYVALYRNIAAHIINSVHHKNTILFDDGNNMFKTIEFLDQNKKKSFYFFRKIISRLLFQKTDIDFIYKSTIFTIFDI